MYLSGYRWTFDVKYHINTQLLNFFVKFSNLYQFLERKHFPGNWPAVSKHLTENPSVLIGEGIITDGSPLTKGVHLYTSLIGIGAIDQSDEGGSRGRGR